MYRVYLGNMLFPVAPAKIEWNYGGRNEMVGLIQGEEICLPRPLGLGKISFEVLLPHQEYPFACYPDGFFQTADTYLEELETLAAQGEPILLVILRDGNQGKNFLQRVVLENYRVLEGAEAGFDKLVRIDLRVYRAYGTVRLEVNADGTGHQVGERLTGDTRRIPSANAPMRYVVQSGDSLWSICQSFYADGSQCWEVAQKNGISNPNQLHTGQVILLD